MEKKQLRLQALQEVLSNSNPIDCGLPNIQVQCH